MLQIPIRYFLVFVLMVSAFNLKADDQISEFDEYIVRHSVIPSTLIRPEIAQEYDLVRSRSMALLNVAVQAREGEPDDPIRAVSAHLEGHVTNSVQQQQRLSFRQVREGDAVYYLAQFQYRDGELLVFNLNVSPYGGQQNLPVRFSRELFHE